MLQNPVLRLPQLLDEEVGALGFGAKILFNARWKLDRGGKGCIMVAVACGTTWGCEGGIGCWGDAHAANSSKLSSESDFFGTDLRTLIVAIVGHLSIDVVLTNGLGLVCRQLCCGPVLF